MIGHPAPEYREYCITRRSSPERFHAALQKVVYLKSRPSVSCGQPIDIWSAGVLFCKLWLHTLSVLICFQETNELEALLAEFIFATNQPKFFVDDLVFAKTMELPYKPDVIPFLRKLLDPNPGTKHTAKSCLEDPWFNDSGTQEDDEQTDGRSLKRRQF